MMRLFRKKVKNTPRSSAYGRRFRFEALEDRRMLSMIWDVFQTQDNGMANVGTLSRAIQDANNRTMNFPSEQQIIQFRIDAATPTVSISGQLPNITAPFVTIDGSNVHSSSLGVRVRLQHGSTSIFPLLKYADNGNDAGHFHVEDLEIVGFDLDAIQIVSLGNNDRVTITRNVIRDNTGPFGSPSTVAGIAIYDIPSGAQGKVEITSNQIYRNGYGIRWEGPANSPTPQVESRIASNNIGQTDTGSPQPNANTAISLGRGVSFVNISSNTITANSASGPTSAVSAIEILSTAGNRIRIAEGNNFKSVVGPPIDLLDDGLQQPNDSGDGDLGPNNLLNYAEVDTNSIAYLPVTNQWQVRYDLDVDATGNYQTEFYLVTRNLTNNTFNYQHIATAAAGNAPAGRSRHVATIPAVFNDGDSLSAVTYGTSDGNAGNTSEFSPSFVMTKPPQVTDVLLFGVLPDGVTPWTGAPYSYAGIIQSGGKQLAPIFTQGVNQIQIAFSERVLIDENHLKLYSSNDDFIPHTGFPSSSLTDLAIWTFPTLGPGKYRIELSTAVTDQVGRPLDGEWSNLTAGTADNFADDPVGPSNTFPSGNGIPGGLFRFHFSTLPGDYNQDGTVTAADTAVDVVRDGDGDGVIENGQNGTNTDDTTIASTAVNTANAYSALRKTMGDYADDDDVVNGADYLVWRSQFGLTGPDLAADGNLSGTVDSADYVLWGQNKGLYSAWVVNQGGGMGSGSSLPVVEWGAAPRVTNVVVDGSQSEHFAFSFDTVDGSGEQLRTVPVGGVDTISIKFSEDVNIQVDHLTFVGLSTAARPGVAEFTYDILTMTATWRFDDLVANDQYAIVLSQAVTDIEGNSLDGEWVNPASLYTVNAAVSEFPSGDGQAGGDFTFVMTLLAGDITLNNIVDSNDSAIISMYFGNETRFFTEGDANGDGFINGADQDLVNATWLKDLEDVWLLGDLNGDWIVDDLDEDILMSNISNSSPTWADGDLNGDGFVNTADLDLMYAQYGLDLEVVA